VYPATSEITLNKSQLHNAIAETQDRGPISAIGLLLAKKKVINVIIFPRKIKDKAWNSYTQESKETHQQTSNPKEKLNQTKRKKKSPPSDMEVIYSQSFRFATLSFIPPLPGSSLERLRSNFHLYHPGPPILLLHQPTDSAGYIPSRLGSVILKFPRIGPSCTWLGLPCLTGVASTRVYGAGADASGIFCIERGSDRAISDADGTNMPPVKGSCVLVRTCSGQPVRTSSRSFPFPVPFPFPFPLRPLTFCFFSSLFPLLAAYASSS